MTRGGDRVRIPKGATVQTTHPRRSSYVLKRAQTVRVDHVLGGYPSGVPQCVIWAGTGGYWCKTTQWEEIP